MYNQGDFHESYYDHGCSIVHEKDVLEKNIKGSTWFANFKRWWYNLFLLSCSNKMCRRFYNSSYAMKVERARHFRHHRNCIHPLSKFRSVWDFTILYTVLASKLIFHHTTSLTSGELPLPFYFLAIMLECIKVFDIYINMKCGYVDKKTKKIELDLRKAVRYYCSTKLFLHVAAAIPLHAIMFLRYGMNVACGNLCKANYFICALEFLDIFSLIRFYEASAYWKREKDSYYTTCFFRFLRICLVGMMVMLQFMAFADTITLMIIINTSQVHASAYFTAILYYKTTGDLISNFSLFAFDYARMFKSLLLFNYGFATAKYHLDVMAPLIAHFIANAVYLWGLIEVFSCLYRGKFPKDQIINNEAAAIKLAKCRQLPDKICLKLHQYYDFNMTKPRIVEKQNGLYKALPLILKKEIKLNSYSRFLMRVPYFTEWPMKVLQGLVLLLKEEIFLKHDVVAELGVQGDGLMVLDVGVMAVYSSEHKEMGHLIDGDYFGELSLVTDKELRTSYVVAVTSCKVLILEKSGFRKFMRNYPSFFFEMKKKLRYRKQPCEKKKRINKHFCVDDYTKLFIDFVYFIFGNYWEKYSKFLCPIQYYESFLFIPIIAFLDVAVFYKIAYFMKITISLNQPHKVAVCCINSKRKNSI